MMAPDKSSALLGQDFLLASSCGTGTVRALIHGIFAERALDRLPILQDALMDAGCDNADILALCADPNFTRFVPRDNTSPDNKGEDKTYEKLQALACLARLEDFTLSPQRALQRAVECFFNHRRNEKDDGHTTLTRRAGGGFVEQIKFMERVSAKVFPGGL